MLTTAQKLAILFNNEIDRIGLASSTPQARTTVIRRMVREMFRESSAMGLVDLEENAVLIKPEELASGEQVTYDLIQLATPLVVRATIQRYGNPGSNYVTVDVQVRLTEVKPSYSMEHPVANFHVESVSVPRLWKRLDRIYKNIPAAIAPLLAN